MGKRVVNKTECTEIPNAIIVDKRLKLSARVIYIYLLSRDYDGDRKVWSGQERIAEETGVCVRTIIDSIATLVEHGYLEIKQHRTTEGKWRGNQYRLLVKCTGSESKCMPRDEITDQCSAVRLPRSLERKLNQLATETDRTKSSVIRELLRRAEIVSPGDKEEKIHVGFRLSPDLEKKLILLARQSDNSKSSVIRELLRRAEVVSPDLVLSNVEFS